MRATAYSAGHPYEIDLVETCGVWVEAATAAALVRMVAAAKADKVVLVPTLGFRAMADQQQIWDSRACRCTPERERNSSRGHTSAKCPVVLSGPVARPGTSRHQAGIAVDIRTGLTFSDFRRGQTTPIFRWLDAHCKVYGFERSVPTEPWHFEHTIGEEGRYA